MKILHTADWHIGHRLLEQSQLEEQTLFLNWIENLIIEQKINVLLISGDVYDTGSPSSLSQKIYYDFLIKLKKTSCQSVVMGLRSSHTWLELFYRRPCVVGDLLLSAC